jgi:hypothetical protein
VEPGVRGAAALLALALGTGCAGTEEPQVAGPPLEAGHGSVEEVVAALERQGVPCADPTPVPLPPGTEQAVECTLRVVEADVLLVHFLAVAGSQAYESEARGAGDHGVYADTWAARTDSPEAAELIARALQNRGRS